MITMKLAFVIVTIATTFILTHAEVCFQPNPEPTAETFELIDTDYLTQGIYDKIVVLFGDKNIDLECRFIHFYNKLTNNYDVSRDLCMKSLISNSMYKSKTTIYVHMPRSVSNSDQSTVRNLELLDKILNNAKKVKNDFILLKYNCDKLEINADQNADSNFNSDQNILKSFSIACINEVMPLQIDDVYDLENGLKKATGPIFKTYFIVDESMSVACTKKKCLLYTDWMNLCKRTEFVKVSGNAISKNCLWKTQKFDFLTSRVTTLQKLSLHMFYDKQSVNQNLNTYGNLINKFHTSVCNAHINMLCQDNLNYVGIANKKVSDLVYKFYDLELSHMFNSEHNEFCNFLYTDFYIKSNHATALSSSNLCDRLKHLSEAANEPSFSDGFFNLEIYKIYGKCTPWSQVAMNKKNSLNILDTSLVRKILSRSSEITKERLETWRKEVSIDERCITLDYVKLLYMIFKHQPPYIKKLAPSSVCIFQGEFLSLTAILDDSRGCKSVVLMSSDTVFFDESRTKVMNQNVETELFIFAPRWITLTTFQNITKLWTRIYGIGDSILDETSSYPIVNMRNNYFELSFGNVEQFKFREHYIIYCQSSKRQVVGSKLNYVDDFMMVVNKRLQIWSKANDIKSSQSEIRDYIFSLELINNQNQYHLDSNIHYLYVNIILTYRTLFSSMDSQSHIVINIERCLDNFQSLLDKNMKKIENKAYVYHINRTTQNHVNVIKSRIAESKFIIKNFQKKLEKTLKNNENTVKKLISEIESDVEVKLEKKRDELKKRRADAEARHVVSTLLGLFSVCTSIVGIHTEGVEKALAQTVSVTSGFIKDIIPETNAIGGMNLEVSKAIFNKIEEFTTSYKSSVGIQINEFLTDINVFKAKLSKSDSQTNQELLDYVKEIEKEVKKAQHSDSDNKLQKILELTDKFSKLDAPLSRIKRQNAEISKIDKENEENERVIQAVKFFKNDLESKIIPSVARFSNDFSSGIENLDKLSKPLLIEMKFLLQKELTKVKSTLNKISTGFKIFDEVIEAGQDLEAIFIATLELHDDIDKSKKDIMQANFIKEMFTPPKIHDINDPKINKMIDVLKHNVSQIVLNNNFKKLLTNIKQWSFPFVDHFIPITALTKTDYLIENPVLLSDFFTEIITNYKTYKTSIIKVIDENLHTADFYNSSSSSPFYTWHFDKYSSEIDSILSGNKTMLRANFDQSLDLSQNIVKFNLVYLDFSCETESLCQQFKKDLEYFQVDLTHLGYSQYRCDNKVYSVYSESLTFSSSFERNVKGESVHKNTAFKKLENGDILLSPYTFWNIKFKKIKNSVNWNILEKYMGKVSISLVGKGSYVRDDSCTFCSSKLDVFYQPDYIF